ncbi:hypothetical protein [Cupriavidus necator]|nr:hypothetical protein [Cupriavidus necator]QQB78807.1 hypothetical protein I6H87_26275 [Cupriavidus necator]WKA43022.1 hypothetical protein QWP09_26750 [Cupriavidus necator]
MILTAPNDERNKSERLIRHKTAPASQKKCPQASLAGVGMMRDISRSM